MEVIIIVAMAANRVIGKHNKIPWHLPEDQKRFRETTWGYPLIMGRRTFESIGHPLPGRRNIVISRNERYRQQGCESASSLSEALQLCRDAEKVFIIGGEQLFKKALPQTETIILTTLLRSVDGDTYFPEFEGFVKVSSQLFRGKDPFTIEVYRRTRSAKVQ